MRQEGERCPKESSVVKGAHIGGGGIGGKRQQRGWQAAKRRAGVRSGVLRTGWGLGAMVAPLLQRNSGGLLVRARIYQSCILPTERW